MALLAAMPLWADWKTWKLVSPSPGTVVCTSTTSGSARRMSSASIDFSRTAAELAPVGGAMVMAQDLLRALVLMNWVGRKLRQ